MTDNRKKMEEISKMSNTNVLAELEATLKDEKPEEKKMERDYLGELLKQLGFTGGEGGFKRCGRYLGLRRYGVDGHYQLTSWCPPSCGNDEVIIHKDDLRLMGILFIKLAEQEGVYNVFGIRK